MEWVETTGRTVAEALDKALDQLGVDEQEAEVQVLDEPQKGLFGRLRIEARVRARVRPVAPRPKAERRDRRRRGGERDRERGGRGRGRERSSAKTATATAGGSGKRPARTDAAGNGTSSNRDQSASSAGGNGSEPGTQDGDTTRKRRRRRRGGQAKKQGAAVENANQDTTTEPRREAESPVAADVQIDVEAQREAVEGFLVELLAAYGTPEAKVTVIIEDEEDPTIDAKVDGDGLGLLVGPKGHTLQAVHELVRSMVQRRFVGESHARIRVDVAGYRQRRREALERFTRTVADEVISSGRAKVLDPMNASDRKVVHDAVNDLDGVQTISEGIEPDRRVIIQPR